MRRLASFLVWPAFVCLAFAAYAACLAQGAGPVGFLLVSTGVVVALLALEPLLPARRQAVALRDPEALRDIGHSLVGQGGATGIGESVLLVGAAVLAGWLGQRLGFALWPDHWPYAVQALAVVAIADGLDYARHRALHTVSWLWPLHELHHGVDRMHVLKSARTHIFDMLLRYTVVFAPLVLLGVPTDVLLWYPVGMTILGPIAHSNVAVRLPSFLHRCLVTPQEHALHHAREASLSRSNYANVFPLWDIVFGTFEHPDDHPEPAFGIDEPVPASFAAQLALPVTRWRQARSEAMASPARQPSTRSPSNPSAANPLRSSP